LLQGKEYNKTAGAANGQHLIELADVNDNLVLRSLSRMPASPSVGIHQMSLLPPGSNIPPQGSKLKFLDLTYFSGRIENDNITFSTPRNHFATALPVSPEVGYQDGDMPLLLFEEIRPCTGS